MEDRSPKSDITGQAKIQKAVPFQILQKVLALIKAKNPKGQSQVLVGHIFF